MNTLAMSFINKAGKKHTLRVPKVRPDVTEVEILELMNLIIAKNAFFEGDQELESVDSATITTLENVAL